MGNAGSGKTECQLWFKMHKNYLMGHPIRPLKSYLENIYNLPDGTLDSQQGKAHIPYNCEQDMEYILDEMFKLWDRVDPYHSSRCMSQWLRRALSIGNATMPSIRKEAEAKAIMNLTSELRCNLLVIKLFRPGNEISRHVNVDGKQDHFIEIMLQAPNAKFQYIENDSSLYELQRQLEDVWQAYLKV